MEPLPDSESYISKLERRLQKIQSTNQKKPSGKELIASMAEFKEIYLRDAFKNNLNINMENGQDAASSSSDAAQLNTEAQGLIQNDWLAESRQSEEQAKAEENCK